MTDSNTRVSGQNVDNAKFDWGSLLGGFIPPSPTDVMKKVAIVAGIVFGGFILLGIIYLVTRRGKGARNA